MNGLPSFDTTFCVHSAMALLHFLWQGLLLAVVAWAAAWCLRNWSAAVRYRLHAAAILLMPVCLPVTFMFLQQEEVRQTPDLVLDSQSPSQLFDVVLPIKVQAETPHATAVPDTSSSTVMEAATVAAPSTNLSAGNLTPVDSIVSPASADPGTSVDRVARWTTAAYLIGVGLMFARMLLGFAGTRRLRRDAQRIDDARLLQSIERRARQFHLRSAPLVAYCNRVAVPALAGLWRPMILLPTSLATGLTPEQLDLVVMHEMAHIRRWDNLWLVVQRVVESILFFHPAVWYVSRRMSLERELCCDEMVVGMAARRADYAESLLRVVELTGDKQLAVPATATMASPRDGSAILVHRLMRILGEPKSSPVRLPRLWPTLGVATVLAASLCVAWLGMPNAPDAAAVAAEEPAQQADVADAESAWKNTTAALPPFALLPGAGYIELLEVNDPSATDMPGWAPNGRSLGSETPQKDDAGRAPAVAEGSISRQFRFAVLRRDMALGCTIAAKGDFASDRLDMSERIFSVEEEWSPRFTLPSEMQKVDLHVEAIGRWYVFRMVRAEDEPVPAEVADGIELRWKGEIHRPSVQTRAVLVDKEGQEISAPAEPGLNRETPTVFKFPGMSLDRIRSWRLEQRYYRIITFRDVSLHGGRFTDPEATSLPDADYWTGYQSIDYTRTILMSAEVRQDIVVRVEDSRPGSYSPEELERMRIRRDRLEYVYQRTRRILADRVPENPDPGLKEFLEGKPIAESEKWTARLIAHHELYKLHAEALDTPDDFWEKYASDLAQPRRLGVAWQARCYNLAKEAGGELGPVEQLLYADLTPDKDEAFIRSAQGNIRYLQRIRVDRDCLKTCHASRREGFDVTDVAPGDRLKVGDVLALLSVEINHLRTPLRRVNLEGAFPTGEHASAKLSRRNAPGLGPVPPGKARIRGRFVHGETGRSLDLAEIKALAADTAPMRLTVAAPSDREAGPSPVAVEFAADGSYLLDVAPGEATVSFAPNRPWVLIDRPDGLEKTFSLVEGQDIRMDLWVVVKREDPSS
ncbi:MAG: M56 family metallopeptidase [Planctomycetaceae bacterium]|nr:M56 family metallopeptidase [Planctomycetaceae bacterium]